LKILIRLVFLLLGGCYVTGCSSTNVSEYTRALVESKRAFCAILNAGPYGGGTIAAGSPDVSVQVSASGCNIEGANVTRVTVPTGNISVTPTK